MAMVKIEVILYRPSDFQTFRKSTGRHSFQESEQISKGGDESN